MGETPKPSTKFNEQKEFEMNKCYFIVMILVMLYTFGIGWLFGTFSGYACCKEKGKINDWESPAEFICEILIIPLLAIICSVILFFKGMRGLEITKNENTNKRAD